MAHLVLAFYGQVLVQNKWGIQKYWTTHSSWPLSWTPYKSSQVVQQLLVIGLRGASNKKVLINNWYSSFIENCIYKQMKSFLHVKLVKLVQIGQNWADHNVWLIRNGNKIQIFLPNLKFILSFSKNWRFLYDPSIYLSGIWAYKTTCHAQNWSFMFYDCIPILKPVFGQFYSKNVKV